MNFSCPESKLIASHSALRCYRRKNSQLGAAEKENSMQTLLA
jgi:hypothetical protein